MKETLSDSFYNMEKLDCFNPKSVTNRVRGFIQKYVQVFGDTCNMRNNTEDKIREAIIYAIEQFKQEAGEELISVPQKSVQKNEDTRNTASPSAPSTSHSPHVSSRLKGRPVTSEDTNDICDNCGLIEEDHIENIFCPSEYVEDDEKECKKFKPLKRFGGNKGLDRAFGLKKGCGEMFVAYDGMGAICGNNTEELLCPACSNNKEARKLKKILLKEHKGANWSLAR